MVQGRGGERVFIHPLTDRQAVDTGPSAGHEGLKIFYDLSLSFDYKTN